MKKTLLLTLGIALLCCTLTICISPSFSADCCTKGAQGSCSLPNEEGYCNTGSNNCDTETCSTCTSSECGETGYEKTPYMVCISANPHVVNCENASSVYYFGRIYYCYCKDDWGWKGSCTLNTVDACPNFPYTSRGPC